LSIISERAIAILAIVLGVIIPVVCIIVLAILLWYLISSRRKPAMKAINSNNVSNGKRTSSFFQQASTVPAVGRPVAVEDFLSHVADMEKDSGLRYAAEFEVCDLLNLMRLLSLIS
jgi:hypothetical protein